MNCSQCNDIGYIQTLKNNEIYLSPCSCKIQKDKETKLASSIIETQIPPIYRNKTFTQFFDLENKEYTKSLDFVVNKYLKDQKYKNGLGIYAWGPVNSGKTFLASLICIELLKNNLNGKFYSFADFLNGISMEWGKFIQSIKNYDFLCLDFFKSEFNQDMFLNFLEDIISYFFENKKILIITSRLSTSRLNESKLNKLVLPIKRFLEEICLPVSYDSDQILNLKKEYNH